MFIFRFIISIIPLLIIIRGSWRHCVAQVAERAHYARVCKDGEKARGVAGGHVGARRRPSGYVGSYARSRAPWAQISKPFQNNIK